MVKSRASLIDHELPNKLALSCGLYGETDQICKIIYKPNKKLSASTEIIL